MTPQVRQLDVSPQERRPDAWRGHTVVDKPVRTCRCGITATVIPPGTRRHSHATAHVPSRSSRRGRVDADVPRRCRHGRPVASMQTCRDGPKPARLPFLPARGLGRRLPYVIHESRLARLRSRGFAVLVSQSDRDDVDIAIGYAQFFSEFFCLRTRKDSAWACHEARPVT